METVPQMGDELRNQDGNSTWEKKKQLDQPSSLPLTRSPGPGRFLPTSRPDHGGVSSPEPTPPRRGLFPRTAATTAGLFPRADPTTAATLPLSRGNHGGVSSPEPNPPRRQLFPRADPTTAESQPQPHSFKMCSPIWFFSGAFRASREVSTTHNPIVLKCVAQFGIPLVLLKQRSIRSISVEASQCDNRRGASMLFLATNRSSTVFAASSEFQTQRSPKRDFEEGVVCDLK